jgi:hypothetical protein
MRPPRGVEPGQPELLGHVVFEPQNASQVTKLWVEKSSGKHHEFIVGMSVWLDGKSIRPAVERHTGFIEEAVLAQIPTIPPVQRLADPAITRKEPNSNRSVTSQKYKSAGDPVSPRKIVRGWPTGLKPSSSADPSGKRQWSAPGSISTIQSTVRSA